MAPQSRSSRVLEAVAKDVMFGPVLAFIVGWGRFRERERDHTLGWMLDFVPVTFFTKLIFLAFIKPHVIWADLFPL